MRKIITINICLFLIIFTLLVLTSCYDNTNNQVSTCDEVSTYDEVLICNEINGVSYDSYGNIIQCSQVPYYGFLDRDEAIANYNSNTGDVITESNIINTYRFASDNSDYLITDYKNGVGIVKYEGNEKNLVIPEFLDGKPVVKLSGYLKKYDNGIYCYKPAIDCSKVSSIILPANLKEIAFGSLHIAPPFTESDEEKKDILERIEVNAANSHFSSIDGILYNKNKSVLLCIPSNNPLKTISIANGTKTVYECISNNTVTLKIPQTLENIEIKNTDGYYDNQGNPAYFLYSLDYIINPVLESIVVDPQNQAFSSDDGVLYNKNKTFLIYYPDNKKGKSFIVPDNVKRFNRVCLNCAKNLETITFGKNIKQIDAYVMHEPIDGLWEDPVYTIHTVMGYKGTVSENFANNNNLSFVDLDK